MKRLILIAILLAATSGCITVTLNFEVDKDWFTEEVGGQIENWKATPDPMLAPLPDGERHFRELDESTLGPRML